MAADDLAEMDWGKLRELVERGGGRSVVKFVQSVPDPEDRQNIYTFAQRAFRKRDWNGKNFDDQIHVVQAGIADAIRQSEETAGKGVAELARVWKYKASLLSYTLAADLADCWPEDAAPRERRHLEAGLRAALDSIRWRHELGKPPGRRAKSYWAMGMHQLSLGNRREALDGFQTAFGLSVEALSEGGTSGYDAATRAPGLFESAEVHVKSGGDFAVILHSGYMGLARRALGDPEGARQLERACSAFEKTIRDFPEMEEDSRVGLDRLRHVERKFAPAGGVSRPGSASSAPR